MVYSVGKIVVIAALAVGLSACGGMRGASPTAELPVYPSPERIASSVPEAEVQLWEEPMVEIIDVPAGLDPEGNYYRPKHRQAVEIRQGYWRNADSQ